MRKLKYLVFGCLMTLSMCIFTACGNDSGSEGESSTDTQRNTSVSGEKQTSGKNNKETGNGGIINDLVTDAADIIEDAVTAAEDVFD